MTNTFLLKAAISNSGLKLSYIAEKLGISTAGLRNKINNKTEFTASEITGLSALLNLNSAMRDQIFLCEG